MIAQFYWTLCRYHYDKNQHMNELKGISKFAVFVLCGLFHLCIHILSTRFNGIYDKIIRNIKQSRKG
jgi:hypothetical protein